MQEKGLRHQVEEKHTDVQAGLVRTHIKFFLK